ncbi:MAG: hypothetical protein QXN05_05685 [Acidilobaceae archaeon]
MESSNASQSLEEFKKAYYAVLSVAKKLEGKVSVTEGSLIAYTRGAEPPASVLYISSTHAGLNVSLVDIVELSLHIIPYRDCESVIVFSSRQKDPRAVNAVIASSILGAKSTLVAPRMHEAYEERLRLHNVNRVMIDSPSPLLTMSLAALIWRPKLMGFRDERIKKELMSLDSALEWLIEGYSFVVERSYTTALYTPATMAGAYYYCIAVKSCNPLPLDALEDSPPKGRLLVMVTSLERKEYEELLKSVRNKAELDIVEFNVDPVTASLYSVLLAFLASGRAV